jgi:hypothetical protein
MRCHTRDMIKLAGPLAGPTFEIAFDEKAHEWLQTHPSCDGLVIAFEVHRCRRGAIVCDVRIRQEHPRDQARRRLFPIGSVADRYILLDSRIVNTMPQRIPVTVRGVGPFRGLRLDLTGPQWGRLLYS